MRKALAQCDSDIIVLSRVEHVYLMKKKNNDSNSRILHIHYDPQTDKRIRNDIDKLIDRVDKIVLLNEDYINSAINYVKKSRLNKDLHNRFVAIGNFISDEDLKHINSYRATLTPINNRVLAVGRLSREKGFDRLIEVWAQFIKINREERAHGDSKINKCQNLHDYKLIIYGEGNEKQDLETMILEFGLCDSVEIRSFIDHSELLRQMVSSTIFVLPSRTEGFGIVLIEAAACGLPLISYDISGGPRLIIEHDVNGYKVNNNFEMAKYISMLLKNTLKRREMSKMAVETSKKWSEKNIVNIWTETIYKLLVC